MLLWLTWLVLSEGGALVLHQAGLGVAADWSNGSSAPAIAAALNDSCLLAEFIEVFAHAFGIRDPAAKDLEGPRRLEHRHCVAIHSATAQSARRPEQLGLRRKIDDVCDPQGRAQ
jgi:hypothetical protein